ncbi:MAG: M28 family peptidase, partial [Candidatus Thorarchaeota archaeon]|nr:M28 family peptidase [Candidatus Thorarchaeota archaeon]
MMKLSSIYPLTRKAAPLIIIAILAFVAVPLDYRNYNRSLNQDTVSKTNLADIVYASDIARNVYQSVSQSSYTNFVREFSEIGTKLYGTPGNVETRNWIVDTLPNVTNNKVIGEIVGSHNNVVGKLQGSSHRISPAIMIGAHYDTISISPGANDDGSGVATTLEIARVLSAYEWPLDIYFGFWNYEESGLFGSSEMATQFRDDE